MYQTIWIFVKYFSDNYIHAVSLARALTSPLDKIDQIKKLNPKKKQVSVPKKINISQISTCCKKATS